MDIGKLNRDDRFYKGYEGEPEFIFTCGDNTLQIWEGYIDDIFQKPIFEKDGWTGFTRDCNEFVGPYEDGCVEYVLDVDEYLLDAEKYLGHEFEYEETKLVLDTLINFLKSAKDSGKVVTASLN